LTSYSSFEKMAESQLCNVEWLEFNNK
jgi:hypothetical protein